MTLARDFGDAAQAERFPRHGWAINNQGIKLLWMPMVALLREAEGFRRGKGVEGALRTADLELWKSFDDTLGKLALTLRELHEHSQALTGEHMRGWTSETMDLVCRTNEMVSLYVDLSYVYLRRLADRLALAGRLVMFQDHGSAPGKFPKLLKALEDVDSLSALRPLGDTAQLRSTFHEHVEWFGLIRTTGETLGVRDRMEHHPGYLDVVTHWLGGPKFEPVVRFVGPAELPKREENLIATLRTAVAGFCDLATAICVWADWRREYQEGDCLVLRGHSLHSTGFWPQI